MISVHFRYPQVFFLFQCRRGIYFGMVDCVNWKSSSPERGSCLISTKLPLSIPPCPESLRVTRDLRRMDRCVYRKDMVRKI